MANILDAVYADNEGASAAWSNTWGSCTLSNEAEYARTGSKSLRVVSDDSSPFTFAVPYADRQDCDASTEYDFSLPVRGNGVSRWVTFTVEWYTSGGAWISSDVIDQGNCNNGSYGLYEGAVTSPGTAASYTLKVDISPSAGSEQFNLDEIAVDDGTGSPQTIAVGQAVETDTAQPITARKTIPVGQAVETDTALPLSTSDEQTITVASSPDDGYIDTAGYYTATETVMLTGRDSANVGDWQTWARFDGLTIPQGATIVSAYYRPVAKQVGTPFTELRAFAQDDPAAPTSLSDYTSRPLTTATVNWDPTGWATFDRRTSPNIATIIQEIVNRAGWASGHAVVIAHRNRGTGVADDAIHAYTYDQAPASAAELVVTYTIGSVAHERIITDDVGITDPGISTWNEIDLIDDLGITDSLEGEQDLTPGFHDTIGMGDSIVVVTTATRAYRPVRTNRWTPGRRPTRMIAPPAPTYDPTTEYRPGGKF
ncbi:MAG: hypothetical protein M5U14_09610 [Acidimicrobiia bacterium]|nr:hypothetical protein [Acidimicrobiia bacterium]